MAMRPLPRLFPLTDSDQPTTRLLVISQEWPDAENARLAMSYQDNQAIISVWEPTSDQWRIIAGPWTAGPQSLHITKALLAHSDSYGICGYDPLAELPQQAVEALQFATNQGYGFIRWLHAWGRLNLALHLGWREYLVVVDNGYPKEVHHDYEEASKA